MTLFCTMTKVNIMLNCTLFRGLSILQSLGDISASPIDDDIGEKLSRVQENDDAAVRDPLKEADDAAVRDPLKEAEAQLRMALSTLEVAFGEAHYLTALCKLDLAECLFVSGALEEALVSVLIVGWDCRVGGIWTYHVLMRDS